MSDNVVPFSGQTTLDIQPSEVLEAALLTDLSSAVVLGHQENGELFIASSKGSAGEILWLIEKCKLALLESVE